MTIVTTGTLSMGGTAGANRSISGEFGGSAPHAMSEYYAGGALVPAGTSGTNGPVPGGGQISMSDFYGTSNNYSGVLTVASNGDRLGFISLNTVAGVPLFGGLSNNDLFGNTIRGLLLRVTGSLGISSLELILDGDLPLSTFGVLTINAGATFPSPFVLASGLSGGGAISFSRTVTLDNVGATITSFIWGFNSGVQTTNWVVGTTRTATITQ